jgi:C-terminal processing protease CtpA/Prc
MSAQLVAAVLLAAAPTVLLAQGEPTPSAAEARATFERAATFEHPELEGWTRNPAGSVVRDSSLAHGGRYSARIHRPAGSEEQAATLGLVVPRTFAGEAIELRGWLRTEDVDGWAGLWLRQDGADGTLLLDNMQSRALSGTTPWTPYSVTLRLEDGARRIALGALLVGEGTVWVDDLDLVVDGAPAWDAPVFVPVPTAAELDTEFDGDSGVRSRPLSRDDVRRLAILGRIWGFMKYHHPAPRGGDVHWDYELFRVLPSVVTAADTEAFERVVGEWIDGFGEPPPCSPCAPGPSDLHLAPRLDWLSDRTLVGDDLGARLRRIHERRTSNEEHQYVRLAEGVGNPVFSGEEAYGSLEHPDAGYRLLALYRFWNIIEYWFPYRDLIEPDWNAVLEEFVPRLMGADSPEAYRTALLELTARVGDTHANLWSELHVQPPFGVARLPVVVRFVEGEAVVTGFSHDELGPASGLRSGDVIESLDGRSISSLVEEWRPFYSASNEPTRLRDMARKLTVGASGPVRVVGRRATGPFTLEATRIPDSRLDLTVGRTHDLPGETFQMLSSEVAYIKLSSIRIRDVESYVRRAEGTEVLIVDIRNYPSEFVVFELGGRLVKQPTEFARFTRGDPINPGAFVWGPTVSLTPLEPGYAGTVVVLVDETSLSQAEYTAMALRAAPRALVVGSTTAGADGNVSPIPLPGGVNSMISGIGVFYPDKSPTQQVGIVPDLEVRPTIEGIRAGRDEVLEAAIDYALARDPQ